MTTNYNSYSGGNDPRVELLPQRLNFVDEVDVIQAKKRREQKELERVKQLLQKHGEQLVVDLEKEAEQNDQTIKDLQKEAKENDQTIKDLQTKLDKVENSY